MTQIRLSVIGSGFAAITALRELRRRNPAADITLIAPRAEFVFLPSLIWIPSDQRRPEDLVVPLEDFLRRLRIGFHAGEVTGLADGGRTVLTGSGRIGNDGLVIASGGRFIKKLPGIEHAITPCEGIQAATAIRDRLAGMETGTIAVGFGGNPHEPSAMRGGPMFEFLFGIDTLLRRQGRRERFQLVFFNPAAEPGKRLGPKAVDGLLREMRRRGITTHLGHKLKGFTARSVQTEGGEFAADLILFMPGMTGNAWFDHSELPRSPGGLVQGDEFCRVPGFERVYVAGDSGSFTGPDWMPKQAHMAELQARAAAANLSAELRGQAVRARFKVELMCVVDSLNKGMLVWRTPGFSLVLPPCRLWHWAKRLFERWYLRRLR